MKNNNFENLISKIFAQLPRKAFEMGSKERVWLQVRSQITLQASRKPAEEQRTTVFLNFVFLRGFFGKLGAVSLIVVVAISVAGGVVRAMPGGTFYPVKKAVEQVEKALAISSEKKFEVATKHADRRLKEVQLLVASHTEPEVVTKTLQELQATTQEAVAITESVPELKGDALALTARGESVLSSVEAEVSGEVREVIVSVKDSLTKLKVSQNDSLPGEEGIKGVTTTEATLEMPSYSTSTPKTIVPQAAVRKLKKNLKPQPIVGDVPIEAGIDIHDISVVGPTGDPVPVENYKPGPSSEPNL